MAFATGRLSPFSPAARERLYIHPRRLGPRHITPPSGTPRRPLLWREVSATQPITPPPCAAPLRGAAPAGDDALEFDADSPGAGRFSVPTIGRAHISHGAAYGPRRRPHRSHPRLRGVQAAQLPDEQEQAQQPRSHHAAQVLQVVPLAYEPPGDALAAEDRSWPVTASERSSARRAARRRTPARLPPSRTGRTFPATSITHRGTSTSATPRPSPLPAATRSMRTRPAP